MRKQNEELDMRALETVVNALDDSQPMWTKMQ
jgi:hypothetical protein